MMKRLVILLAAILAVTTAVPSQPVQPVAGQGGAAVVTGAGAGLFSDGAVFGGISLRSLRFGQGVLMPSDGSASGQFQATLLGTSALGQPREIAVEGEASSGYIQADGGPTFSGLCTLDMGDGTPYLPGVPFTVTAKAGAVVLTLAGTVLTAKVTAGGVTVN